MTSWRPLHPYTYSLDLGGAAAAGVLQEGWRQETGAKGGASRLPLPVCLLTISGLYLGKFPQTPLCNPYSLHLPPTPYTYSLLPRQMSATSGAKRLRVVSCLLPLHLL